MKKISKLLVVFASFLGLSGVSFKETPVHALTGINGAEAPATAYSGQYVKEYYNSIEGLKKDALLEGLAEISQKNHKYFNTYGEVRGGNAYSDADPSDPENYILDFYTGFQIPNAWDNGTTWNREHVWCQSLSGGLYGTSGAGADIHHIRPLISSINSARNNALYADLENSEENKYYYKGQDTGCYNIGQSYFEPRDEAKGDVARILMYMYMHYSVDVAANVGYSYAGDLNITNIVYTSSNSEQAAWDLLLSWNKLDPVDKFESDRNTYCTTVTGVRNPFIDHSEFADIIWNNSYTGNGALLDDQVNPDTPYLNVYPVSKTLLEGETYQVVPVTNIENPTFTYTSTNSTIASVSSSGLVSANKEGQCKINVEADNLTASIDIIVEGISAAESYQLVTSVDELVIGDTYVIAAIDKDVALSTNQKNNNRGEVEVTRKDNLIEINDQVQLLTLQEGVKANTYAFNTGNGYLYAASSSSNYLRTQTTLDENGSFKITIDSSGKVSAIAQGSNTRNVLQYNQSSSLFACYSSASQKGICLYKKVGGETPVEKEDSFIVSYKAQLSYTAHYLDYKLSGVDNIKFILNASFEDKDICLDNKEGKEGLVIDCYLVSKNELTSLGNNIKEVYYENKTALDAINLAKTNKPTINEHEIIIDSPILQTIDEELIFVCFATNQEGSIVFSNEISLSINKLANIYINNQNYLSSLTEKEKADAVETLNYILSK